MFKMLPSRNKSSNDTDVVESVQIEELTYLVQIIEILPGIQKLIII